MVGHGLFDSGPIRETPGGSDPSGLGSHSEAKAPVRGIGSA